MSTEQVEVKPARIYQAVVEVMAAIEAIGKGRQADKFKFRGIDDVYNELHDPMTKAGIFTSSKIKSQEHDSGTYASGGAFHRVKLLMEYTFWAVDGSSVTTETLGIGMDNGDKAGNKAMAVAHKYALMQMFSIPTEDTKDPETDNTPMAPAKKAQAAAPAPSQSKQQSPAPKTAEQAKAATAPPGPPPAPSAPAAAAPATGDPAKLKSELLGKITGKNDAGKYLCANLGDARDILKELDANKGPLGLDYVELFAALSNRCREHMEGLMRTDAHLEGLQYNWETVYKDRSVLFIPEHFQMLETTKDEMKAKLPSRKELGRR